MVLNCDGYVELDSDWQSDNELVKVDIDCQRCFHQAFRLDWDVFGVNFSFKNASNGLSSEL